MKCVQFVTLQHIKHTRKSSIKQDCLEMILKVWVWMVKMLSTNLRSTVLGSPAIRRADNNLPEEKRKEKEKKEAGKGWVWLILMHPSCLESADVPAVRLVLDGETGGGVEYI